MVRISELERHILGVILGSSNRASGYEVKSLIKKHLGRDVSFGSLYAALEKLELKGFVDYELGEGGEERGGRPQRFFRVSGSGHSAFTEQQRFEIALHKLSVGGTY